MEPRHMPNCHYHQLGPADLVDIDHVSARHLIDHTRRHHYDDHTADHGHDHADPWLEHSAKPADLVDYAALNTVHDGHIEPA
jgi:hypothetical protein